jgi:hypothetical protein
MQTKEQIFEDFKKLKSNKSKVKYLEGHRDAQKAHPNQYNHLSVKWDNLIIAYQQKNPRDYFYKQVFGRTYQEQMDFESAQDGKEEELNERKTGNPKELKLKA